MKEEEFFLKPYTFQKKDYVLPTPKKCPHCLGSVSLSIRGVFYGPISEKGLMIYLFLFQCHACDEMFIGRYLKDDTKFYQDKEILGNKLFYPNMEFTEITFPPEISIVSPHFSELYNQAAKAEHYGCTDIAGAGYRKAVEFLIRDFAIYLLPLKKDNILATRSVVNVVINFLSQYTALAQAANASYDLGNSETHYTKVYKHRDLKDLKDFLEITIREIVAIIKLRSFQQEQNEHRKKQEFMPVQKVKQK